MAQGADEEVRVVCEACDFSKVVNNSDGRAADVMVEHGRETGHRLFPEPLQTEK